MSVDRETVRRIARLARIALEEEQVDEMAGELNNILSWIEQLGEVDVEGVEPLTSVIVQHLRMREDEITEGGHAEALMANAPESEDHFFVVPKILEQE
jgi:aspartyl-tRNA(Asn)/glutamyl-tRNA(Gln) amidotransferase subunit C